MVLGKFVGERLFAGGPIPLQFRMDFEQIHGPLEWPLKIFNNYTWTFLEFVVISGKFNVVGMSGVFLAILTLFGEISRRKSVPERPSCIGKRVSRKLKETGKIRTPHPALNKLQNVMLIVFPSQPIFLGPGGYSLRVTSTDFFQVAFGERVKTNFSVKFVFKKSKIKCGNSITSALADVRASRK